MIGYKGKTGSKVYEALIKENYDVIGVEKEEKTLLSIIEKVDLVIDFTPSIIVMSYRRNASECLTVLNNIGTMGTANNVKCSIYNYSNYSNSSFNFKNDANIIQIAQFYPNCIKSVKVFKT